MTYGIGNIMIRNYFLFFGLISTISGIRVDWNTNKGPIIPPTTTERPIPQQPYRNPAPVWENQDDDIPNPNPYLYILPPPSRPKLETDNYARAPISPKQEQDEQQKQQNYGKVIKKYNNDNDYNSIKTVPTLAVQYIPNVGFKYNAVVPVSQTLSPPPSSFSSAKVHHSSKDTDYYYYDKYSKLNGKYNPKSKKYKVYEKVKYVPQVFIFTHQALPYLSTPQPFISQQPQFTTTIKATPLAAAATTTTTTTTTSTSTTTRAPHIYYQYNHQNQNEIDRFSKQYWSQKSSYYQPNAFAQSNTKSQR